MGFLAEAVVVEAEVHGGGFGGPHPDGGLGGVGIRSADIDLGGVLLPEIAHAEEGAAGDAAEVGDAGGAVALVGVDPGVACLGALADGEAVGVELGEREVSPCRDVVDTVADAAIPLGDGRRGEAVDLGLADSFAGVAPEAGDAARGLGPEAGAFADEADVAVVDFVGHGDIETESEGLDEVGLLIAVVDESMDYAGGIAASVEIESDGEGQPGAAGVGAVETVELDDGADGAALLDDGGFGDALEIFDGGGFARFVAWLVLAHADEAAVGGDGLAAALEGGEEEVALLGYDAAGDSGIYGDGYGVFGDGERVGWSDAGAFGVGDGIGDFDVGWNRLAGPLDGAVGPGSGGPGLGGDGGAARGEEVDVFAWAEGALWPGEAESGAGLGGGSLAADPMGGVAGRE